MPDRSVIDEIKERLDVVDVIGRYVPLKKAGRSYRALCPFHQEKTPSFYVFPDTGTWRCFGACGTGGDVISFVQKKENLDFMEAIRMLAAMAGVELRERTDSVASSQLNKLRELNELAVNYFHNQLYHHSQSNTARQYLERRQLDEKTITDFHIGFAPEGWDNLLFYMRERGFSQDELEKAGLVVRRDDGGVYDRFRNRIIIPICDASGRTIGFGGRVLDDRHPKYLNTPQTPLFDKGHVIFALDKAKRAMRSLDQVILVEGYMDVISAHQRGFTNVVAAMGTAITPDQLRLLSKYTHNLIFALDADAAGLNATVRSLHVARETLSAQSVPVPTARGRIRYERRLTTVIKIAVLPPDQDPDDVLRRDPAVWSQLIDQATPLVDFFFKLTAKELDLDTATGKSQLVSELLPLIAEIDDLVERRHYVSKLAIAAGVSEREIDMRLESFQRRQSRSYKTDKLASRDTVPPTITAEPPPDDWSDEPEEPISAALVPPRFTDPYHSIEQRIILYLVTFPNLLAWADSTLGELFLLPITADDFYDAIHKAIFDAEQKFLYSDASAQSLSLRDHLDPTLQSYFDVLRQQSTDLVKIREEQLQKDIVDLILRLRHKRTEQACAELALQLRSIQDDRHALQEIGAQFTQKTKELKALARAISSRSHTDRWLNGRNKRY